MIDDRPAIAVRFALSAAGRPLYSEILRRGRRFNVPGLCFGTTVIGELELWTAGTMTYPVVDVRYVPKIENPHEILYGPHAKALGLPALEPGSVTLPRGYACANIDVASGVFASGTLDGPQVTVNGVPRCSL